MKKANTVDDVWKFVRICPTDCWEWIGAPHGLYGEFSIKNKRVLAHRAAYMSAVGPIPEGIFVCHTCDNGKCCRPSHLFLGTPKDNYDDMCRKGRRGLAGRSKLTPEQVSAIRKFTGQRVLCAAIFNVSPGTIYRIKSGKAWGHLQ